MDINDKLWVPSGCSCKKDGYGKILPNEELPCEWHFVFDLLDQPTVSERIKLLQIASSSQVLTSPRTLKPRIDFSLDLLSPFAHPSISKRFSSNFRWSPTLDLNECRFILSTFQHLTTLVWKGGVTDYADFLFSASRPLPELRSVTFEGHWKNSLSLSQVNNLTSFTVKNNVYVLVADEFRSFVLNNLSLVSLEVFAVIREHAETEGNPVILPNLKSLGIDCDPKAFSAIIQVPTFQPLSTLRVSLENECDDLLALRATGEEILVVAKSKASKVQEGWHHLTGYAERTIREVYVCDEHLKVPPSCDSCTKITALMAEAHTVYIGLTYSGGWDHRFWNQLELLEELRVLDLVWDRIADLVEHRFRNGRPLQAVKRMVVSKDEEVDRLQDVLWRQFFEGRRIRNYLAPGK